MQHKAVWADEKAELKKRLEQLNSRVTETKDVLSKEAGEYNKVGDWKARNTQVRLPIIICELLQR